MKNLPLLFLSFFLIVIISCEAETDFDSIEKTQEIQIDQNLSKAASRCNTLTGNLRLLGGFPGRYADIQVAICYDGFGPCQRLPLKRVRNNSPFSITGVPQTSSRDKFRIQVTARNSAHTYTYLNIGPKGKPQQLFTSRKRSPTFFAGFDFSHCQ